jgi:hypothetical protein
VKAGQDGLAHRGMLFHAFEFRVRKRTPLLQDVVGQTELADVMQQTGHV